LRVVQDRVCGVDRVLSVDVPAFGGLPVLLEPSMISDLTTGYLEEGLAARARLALIGV
jgi:hypothetical protein